jgi:hypothetical protein
MKQEMDLPQLMVALKNDPRCLLYPAEGVPVPSENHRLPEDVEQFYRRCGGLTLFKDSSAPTYIVPAREFVLANPVIVGELAEYDISSYWYIIASDGTDSQKMTMDLHPKRLGHCYDSFWDRHAVAGSSRIIALSFTEFLYRTYEGTGEDVYWKLPGFSPLGDAYD